MITRGHLIGQIIDDLAGISAQAKQRARLHLFDIHTYVEDFAKQVLSLALNLDLSNLNATRSNNPGLDLGDEAKGWAFQITSDKSSAKVKETLSKIDHVQRKKFPNIRILIIGEKQSSYSFSGDAAKNLNFNEGMIWDFNDVCRQIMGLPIETLSTLATYVSNETRRVRIELEIPDEDGKFTTNIEHLFEALPKPTLTDGKRIAKHLEKTNDLMVREDAEKAIAKLSAALTPLPRLTREIFMMLMERRDERTVGMYEDFRVSAPKLEKIYRGDDLKGDLSLLRDAGLIDLNEPDEEGGLWCWQILFPGREYGFHSSFVEFAQAKKISLRKPLVNLDFSDF